MLSLVSEWAIDNKVIVHLSDTKTTAQLISASQDSAVSSTPLLFPRPPPAFPAALQWASLTKWLGLRWSYSQGWVPHVAASIAACESMVSVVCGFLDSGRVPLAIAS